MSFSSSAPSAVLSGTFGFGDMEVHRLGYGTMRLVGEGAWGEPPDREAARNVLRRALELGTTLLDTADAYGPGIAEELIAEALHPYPANLLIATKGGLTRQGPAKSKPCGRPDYIQQQLEMSLRRLRIERIELYQLHRIDPTVPVAETLGALKEAQQQGKIRHIGLSEVSVAEIQAAQKTVNVASVQNRYNLTERKSEDVLKFCELHSIAFLPWYPMNAGKIAKSAAANEARTNHPVQEFAQQHGATVSQISLAWLLQHSPVILPIPGTSSIAHLEENVASAGLQISEDDWDTFELMVDSLAM